MPQSDRKRMAIVSVVEATDGVRTRFTLTRAADTDQNLVTFWNGLAQGPEMGSYAPGSTTQIDLAEPPPAGWQIQALIELLNV